MVEENPLHLVRFSLDPRVLVRRAHLERVPVSALDDGYMVHAGLWALFGDRAPQPFVIDPDARGVSGGRRLQVLGYGAWDAGALRSYADTYAEPAVYTACDWVSLASKLMPVLEVGRRLGFRVRVCPVVRAAESVDIDLGGRRQVHYRKGAEVDVFVARACKADPEGVGYTGPSREAVYAAWLGDQIARAGGARLITSPTLVSFRRVCLFRRDSQLDAEGRRKPRYLERPDAVLEGVVEVTDVMAFARLLERGVGRHRAFGFGMLLLRPSSRPC